MPFPEKWVARVLVVQSSSTRDLRTAEAAAHLRMFLSARGHLVFDIMSPILKGYHPIAVQEHDPHAIRSINFDSCHQIRVNLHWSKVATT